jgi:hypothetical protein
VDGNVIDAYFKVRNSINLNVDTYRGNQNLPTPPLFDADCSNNAINVIGWNYTAGVSDTSTVCEGLVNLYGSPDSRSGEIITSAKNVSFQEGNVRNVIASEILVHNTTSISTNQYDAETTVNAFGQNRISYSEDLTTAGRPWGTKGDISIFPNDTVGPVAGMQATKMVYDTAASVTNTRTEIFYSSINDLVTQGSSYLCSFWLLPGNNLNIDTVNVFLSDRFDATRLRSYRTDQGWYRLSFEMIADSQADSDDELAIDPFFYDSALQPGDSLWISGIQLQAIPEGMNRSDFIEAAYIPTNGDWILEVDKFTWNLEDTFEIKGEVLIDGNLNLTGDFQRTDRAEGNEDTTTDGTGDVTITHSLGFTPTNINVTPLGTGGSPLLPQVLSNTINSTTFTVRWFTPSTGLAATSAAVNFHWSAE